MMLFRTTIVTAVVWLASFCDLRITFAAVPDLPFGDINVVVLTDVHSWVGGHGEKQPYLNAGYGEVLSFYERLKEYCDANDKDLWFVVNGDWIDGTGLAMNGDPSHLVPLLEKMPWDAVNVGNHELYRTEVIEFISRPAGYAQWWGDAYLTSNVVHAESLETMGNRYRVLKGKHSAVLAFGFLYNMDNNSPAVVVERVEEAVESGWFSDALHYETFDAIMVLAHMDVTDPLVLVILNKIRNELGKEMPVQFITGHTHYRGYENLDQFSASFEAGHYLDTIGFVSFPTKETAVSGVMPTTGGDTISQLEPEPEPTGGDTMPQPGPEAEPEPEPTGGDTIPQPEPEPEPEPTGDNGDLLSPPDDNVTTSTTTTLPPDDNTTLLPDENSDLLPDDNTLPPAEDSTATVGDDNNSTDYGDNSTIVANETDTTTNTAPPQEAEPVPPGYRRNLQSSLFQHRYLDANVDLLAQVLGVSPLDLATENGQALSDFIAVTQDAMGLEETISCLARSYYMNSSVDADDSLWGFFRDEVVPSQFAADYPDAVVMLGKGSWRFDLLEGLVVVDDVLEVSTFNQSLYALTGVPARAVAQLNNSINENRSIDFLPELPDYIMSPATDFDGSSDDIYKLIVDEFDMDDIKAKIAALFPEAPTLVPVPTNKTTSDIWIDYFRARGMDCPKPVEDAGDSLDDGAQALNSGNRIGITIGLVLIGIFIAGGAGFYFIQNRRIGAPRRKSFNAVESNEGDLNGEVDEFEDEMI